MIALHTEKHIKIKYFSDFFFLELWPLFWVGHIDILDLMIPSLVDNKLDDFLLVHDWLPIHGHAHTCISFLLDQSFTHVLTLICITYRSLWNLTCLSLWNLTCKYLWNLTYRSLWNLACMSLWNLTYRSLWNLTNMSMEFNLHVYGI